MRKVKPKILVDSREKNRLIYKKLKEDSEGIVIKKKSGGSGDYILIDENNNRWGVERKAFFDCYGSIITKDADGKTGRIYGQLAQLLNEYGKRSILLVELPPYIPVRFRKKIFRIRATVFTFFSERSLIMPTMVTRDPAHTAYLLKRLVKTLHKLEFTGRGFKVSLDVKKGKTLK